MITKSEIQKNKKVVLQSFLISIALTGGIGTSTFSALLGMSPLGLDASADAYSWEADRAVNSGNIRYNETFKSAEDVTFDDPEAAVVGKWVNLEKVEGVARVNQEIFNARKAGRSQSYIDTLVKQKASGTYNQWIDYQVKNVYVRKDETTGKNIAAYVGGKTQISIWPKGMSNSVSIKMGKDGQPNSYTQYKKYSRSMDDYRKLNLNDEVIYAGKAVEPNRFSFDKKDYINVDKEHVILLSDKFPKGVDSIEVSYKADKGLGEQSYTTPKLQLRTQNQLKTEIETALKRSVESKEEKKKTQQAVKDAKQALYDAIDQDKSLTKSEKADQKFEVDRVFSGIEYDVDKLDNKDDIVKLINKKKAEAEQKHVKNPSVQERQAEVFKTIEDAAKQKRAEIDNDHDLTKEEREKLYPEVDKIVASLKQQFATIDNADDLEDQILNRLPITAFAGISMKPNQTLANRKDNAKKSISDAGENAKIDLDKNAIEAKAKIDLDGGLSADEKQKQKDAIDNAVTDAKQKISSDDTNDAEKVNDIRVKAEADLKVLSAKKKEVRRTAARLVTDKMTSIDHNDQLTEEQQKDYDAKLTDDYTKFVQKVDEGLTTDDLPSAAAGSDFAQEIEESAKVEENVFSKNQEAAKKALQEKADQAMATINGMDNLTDDEKVEANRQVQEEADRIKGQVSDATTASRIKELVNGAVMPVPHNLPLSDLIKEAQNEAEAKASEAKQEVRKNSGLTDEQLNELDLAIDNAKKTYAESFNGVPNATELAKKKKADTLENAIKRAKENAIEMAAENKRQQEKKLREAKDKVAGEVKRDADAKRAEIDKMTDLAENQREKLKQKITDAENQVKNRIEAVDNVDTMDGDLDKEKSGTDLEDALNQAKGEVAKTLLDNKKKARQAVIDQKEKDANAAIDKLDNLSETEKSEAKKAIKEAAQKNRDAVNAATDDDAFNNAENTVAGDKGVDDAVADAKQKDWNKVSEAAAEAEKTAKEAAAKKAEKDEADRLAKDAADAERLAKEEAEKAKNEAARLLKEKEEADKKAKEAQGAVEKAEKEASSSENKGADNANGGSGNQSGNGGSGNTSGGTDSQSDNGGSGNTNGGKDNQSGNGGSGNTNGESDNQSGNGGSGNTSGGTDNQSGNGGSGNTSGGSDSQSGNGGSGNTSGGTDNQSGNGGSGNTSGGTDNQSGNGGSGNTSGGSDNQSGNGGSGNTSGGSDNGSSSKSSIDDLKKAANAAKNAATDAQNKYDVAANDASGKNADAKSKASDLNSKKNDAEGKGSAYETAQSNADADAEKRQAALDAAKNAAQAAIDKQKADAEKKVKTMLDLAKDSNGNVDSEVQKAAEAELNKINQDYEKAKAGITGAQDSDNVAKLKNDFNVNDAVDAVKQKLEEKTDSNKQKAAAKEAVKQKVEEANKSLDNLDGLDEKTKAIVQDKMKADANKAKDDIENRVAGLDKLVDGGNHDTDSLVDIVNNTNFDQDVADAKNKVKQFADALKQAEDKVKEDSATRQAAIDAMDKLSGADKEAAKRKIQEAEKKALDAIDAAQSAGDVADKQKNLSFDQEASNIITDLDNQDSLDKQKKDATDLIDQDASLKKAAINGMDNISDAEKTKARNHIDEEASKAKKASMNPRIRMN